MSLADVVQSGWEALAADDFENLVNDYTDEMTFVMPGQSDQLEGKHNFRAALNHIDKILPPGFEIMGLRHIEGQGEVVSLVEWRSYKVAESQLVVLFKFDANKIFEERWFIDTEQWKSAF